MKKTYIAILSSLTLISCASAPYPCGEPGAGNCKSVTSNYDRSFGNYTNPDDMPSNDALSPDGIDRTQYSKKSPQAQSATGSSSGSNKTNYFTSARQYGQVPANGSPLLSTPKMMRVWITPYTDNDNIYHDQYYEYMIVDRGTWNFNNNQNLLDNADDVIDVSQGQVSNARTGGYGAYGLSNKPVDPPKSTPSNPIATPSIGEFPALNMMQNGQPYTEVETHVGSGVDTTTTLLP